MRVRSYQDLRVWQAGMDLVIRVYRMGKALPAAERYGLVSQMRRAVVSIPANIAEGHGRSHLGDKLRHLSVANGSLKELETEVLIAVRLGYVSSKEGADFTVAAGKCGKMLTCLMRSLRRHAASPATHNPPPTT
jgi:four helix bundle protein